MKVGVFIPCHNDGDKLPTCLNALLKQTSPPDRILVVLDRCTDNSLQVAKRYGVEWREFTPKHSSPCAVSEVINHGMELLGEDCKIGGEVDCDEIVDSNWIEKLAPMLNDKIAVVSGLHFECHSGSLADLYNKYAEWYRKRASRRGSAIPNQYEPTGGARLFWMSTWKKVGGYARLWSCDNEYDHRVAKLGYKFAVSTETKDIEYRKFDNAKQWFKRKYRYGYGEYALGFPFAYLLQRVLRETVFSLIRVKNLKVSISILASGMCLLVGWVMGSIVADQFVTKEVCRERIARLVQTSLRKVLMWSSATMSELSTT